MLNEIHGCERRRRLDCRQREPGGTRVQCCQPGESDCIDQSLWDRSNRKRRHRPWAEWRYKGMWFHLRRIEPLLALICQSFWNRSKRRIVDRVNRTRPSNRMFESNRWVVMSCQKRNQPGTFWPGGREWVEQTRRVRRAMKSELQTICRRRDWSRTAMGLTWTNRATLTKWGLG